MSGRNQGKDPINAELADLRREINTLKQQLRQIPSRFPVADPNAAEVSSIRETITQVAHGLVAGNVVYNNAGTWAKAQANSDTAAGRYTGVIESVTTDTFVIVYAGTVTLSALSAGTTYYLSDATAGLMVVRATITANALLIPVCRAISATAAIVMSARDQAGDLQKIVVGDKTDGGGSIRVNSAATTGVSIGASITVDAGSVEALGASGSAKIDPGQDSIVVLRNTAGQIQMEMGCDQVWGGRLYFMDEAGITRFLQYVNAAGDLQMDSSYRIDIGGATSLRLQVSGSGTLGFFTSYGTTKPTVTGSRGGNAALASLLTALHDLGLVLNSSS